MNNAFEEMTGRYTAAAGCNRIGRTNGYSSSKQRRVEIYEAVKLRLLRGHCFIAQFGFFKVDAAVYECVHRFQILP